MMSFVVLCCVPGKLLCHLLCRVAFCSMLVSCGIVCCVMCNLLCHVCFILCHVSGSPFNARVQGDSSQILVSGPSLNSAGVGKTSFFTMSNVSGNVEDIEVNVEGKSPRDTFKD